MLYDYTAFNAMGKPGVLTTSQAEGEITGDNTPYPTQTYSPQSTDNSVFTDTANILGSIGETARNVGIAVGTIKREVAGVKPAYEEGVQMGRYPNRISSAWTAMSDSDKMMIVLGVVGVAVAVWAAHK
jgi:hypothetical protein